MNTTKTVSACILGTCITVLGTPAMSSHALPSQEEGVDSTIEAHREREQLLAMVADLQSELAAARKRIAALEAEIASSNTEAPTPPPAAPRSPEATGYDPTNPELDSMANPTRILFEIKDGLQDAWRDDEINFDPEKFGPGIRQYEQWAERWTERTNRAFQKPVSWPVRILKATPINNKSSQLTVVTVSPDGTTDIGDPFVVNQPRRIIGNLERAQRHSDTPVHYRLRGTFRPNLRVNPDRIKSGPFNNPQLLAPMIEYSWMVDAKSISPIARRSPDGDDAN